MISRWIVHFEWHRGYRPRLRVRKAPRRGDVVWNGDILCVLDTCDPCSGDGFLARELDPRVDRHRGTVGRGEMRTVPSDVGELP